MGNCLKLQRAAVWADGDEWEEEELAGYEGKAAAAAAEAKVEVKIRVTIRITKRQLHELMEKTGSGHGLQLPAALGGGRRSTEQLLADIMNSGEVHVHDHREEHWHWRPALQSIPEAVES
ncbi:hypothetical protein HU200_007575 [Digitaria exilis]|uniref:Uncharacterized protein n=1 Tax=Digitaria exilis TaxID=1010633 RepID=A0A835FNS6_9POAL|nr:hypothetical protein HU200_007575 [Digitaria exilis]